MTRRFATILLFAFTTIMVYKVYKDSQYYDAEAAIKY